jgi:hypothetical protein
MFLEIKKLVAICAKADLTEVVIVDRVDHTAVDRDG